MTFNEDRGGNRLQISLREVIFARFNYHKLVKDRPEVLAWNTVFTPEVTSKYNHLLTQVGNA
ncbi:hypothetical protein V144x_44400 [Gimesia aquarii]|uniref:Uncharacterized protein n=1 Tax=Gimesia aquarii TaxID=2527964 RepID=A0A517W106_9PLAN|nr:hypothetical protein V144x_44400 [Gimesia aquarii]